MATLMELWKKVQEGVSLFELSVPDSLHYEFALLFVTEAFPVSVISCIQINAVFQYVRTGNWKQRLFVLHLCSEQ